jgi:predicted MFS family arabinose efflux permease
MSFARLIGTSTGIKILVDTSVQIFNPFLSIIAAGMGVSVITMGRLISLRAAMGLFAPLFGSYADQHGYRRTIQVSLALVGTGMMLVGLSPHVAVAAIGMAVMGLGAGSFVPMIHAYLSARLPWNRRARGLGIVEYSWALAGILGLSLAGWLIAVTNWRVPMVLLSFGLFISVFVFAHMPATGHAGHVTPVRGSNGMSPWQRARDFFALETNARSAWGAILGGGLNTFAAVQLMIIYGAWMADVFGMGAAALGTVAFVFGWFDLAASVSVSLFADRLGKRRSVLIGLLISFVGYLLVPLMDSTPLLAVLAVAITRCGFEFAIVSNFPLLSDQSPNQRGKVLSLATAFGLTLAAMAGFTSPWLYTEYGIRAVTTLSAAAAVLSLVVVYFQVKERHEAAAT